MKHFCHYIYIWQTERFAIKVADFFEMLLTFVLREDCSLGGGQYGGQLGVKYNGPTAATGQQGEREY